MLTRHVCKRSTLATCKRRVNGDGVAWCAATRDARKSSPVLFPRARFCPLSCPDLVLRSLFDELFDFCQQFGLELVRDRCCVGTDA